MAEIWADIPGYEGRYQASDQGRIRSVDNFVRCGRGGKGRRLVKGRVLRDAPLGDYGHRCVALGKGSTMGVHICVALAFLGPRPEGYDVAHWDGDAEHNAASNLRYSTRADNNRDRIPTGKGKITMCDVEALRLCRNRQEALRYGRARGISDSYANNIRLGHSVVW